jgi:hypothetical protein
MKELHCPHCNSATIHPPAEGKRKWKCETCGSKFKIKSKDAGKILRHADEKGIELGAMESFLISAILEKNKKHDKAGKKKKNKKHKKDKKGIPPIADAPSMPPPAP